MSEQLNVTFINCPHGVWQSHNAVMNDDGSYTYDKVPCNGGSADVEGIGRFGISPAMGMTLRQWEDESRRPPTYVDSVNPVTGSELSPKTKSVIDSATELLNELDNE
jgi:hypothetical protein